MGFDISFHPVDTAFIEATVFPYVRGESSLDEVVARAVATEKVRFRAKAWALGVLSGRPPRGFETDLHVWGRPFLIAGDEPSEVSAAIDRYLAATPETVDALCREMLERIAKGLSKKVAPDEDAELPSDQEIAESVRFKLDDFRKCYAAIQAGKKKVKISNGHTIEPRSLFETDFALAVIEFAARFRPGWMARGVGWPTMMLGAVKSARSIFESPEVLLAPVLEPLGVELDHEGTISENFMVGGFVPAKKVPRLAQALEKHEEEALEALTDEDWEEDEARLHLRKVREAVADAASRKIAFCEATEVYSAPSGIMN